MLGQTVSMESLEPVETHDSIFGHLAMRQTEFEENRFFEFLRSNPSPEWLSEFIPNMGFWVHTFQDTLKLIARKITDPTMKQIAVHIQTGDTGHNNWFCRDMKVLGLDVPTLPELYKPEHEAARLTSYAIISEIFRAHDDRLLIVLLLAMEAASYVFFESMTVYFEENEFPVELHYFGRTHLDAELHHGIVEAEMDMRVEAAIERSREIQTEALAIIDRVFATFTDLFDSFVAPPESPGH